MAAWEEAEAMHLVMQQAESQKIVVEKVLEGAKAPAREILEEARREAQRLREAATSSGSARPVGGPVPPPAPPDTTPLIELLENTFAEKRTLTPVLDFLQDDCNEHWIGIAAGPRSKCAGYTPLHILAHRFANRRGALIYCRVVDRMVSMASHQVMSAGLPDGKTPLHCAAAAGNYDVCKALLEKRACPNVATLQRDANDPPPRTIGSVHVAKLYNY